MCVCVCVCVSVCVCVFARIYIYIYMVFALKAHQNREISVQKEQSHISQYSVIIKDMKGNVKHATPTFTSMIGRWTGNLHV